MSPTAAELNKESIKNLDLVGKKYRDLANPLKDTYSKEEFKAERRRQRMAGDVNLSDTNKYGDPIDTGYAGGSPTFNERSGRDETYIGADGTVTYGKDTFPDGAPIMDPGKDDLYSYDFDGYGAGWKKGTDRLSKKDLKNLKNQGYGLQDIIDFSEDVTADGSVLQGQKARNLLNKWKTSLMNDGTKPTEEEETIEIIDTDPSEIIVTDDREETGGTPPYTPDPEPIVVYPGKGGGGGTNVNSNIGNIYAKQTQDWNQSISVGGNGNNIYAPVDSSNNITGGTTKIINYNPGSAGQPGFVLEKYFQ